MSLADLTPEILRELLALHEKKEALLSEIAKLDAAIERLIKGVAPSVKPGDTTGPPGKPTKKPKAKKVKPLDHVGPPAKPAKVKANRQARGSVKEAVLSALTGKPEGVSVPELAKLTGSTPAGLHSFFATAGKKIEGLTKVGRGVWAYSPDGAPSTATQSFSLPANTYAEPPSQGLQSFTPSPPVTYASAYTEPTGLSTYSPTPPPASAYQDRDQFPASHS